MRSIRIRRGTILGVLLGLPMVIGCGSTGATRGATSETSFAGTLAGTGGETGTLTVTIEADVAALKAQSSDEVTATGVCIFVDQPEVALTGTYNTSTDALSLTGDGTTFTGTVSSDGLSGTFENPTTGLDGGFSALDSTEGSVTTLCGTYEQSSPGDDVGVFNVQVDSDGNLSGTSLCTSGEGCSPIDLSGTVTGDTVNGMTIDEGVTFEGTITTNSDGSQAVSGTFEGGDAGGTFSGGTASCESSG